MIESPECCYRNCDLQGVTNQLDIVIDLVYYNLEFENTLFCYNLSHENVVVCITQMNHQVQIKGYGKEAQTTLIPVITWSFSSANGVGHFGQEAYRAKLLTLKAF